MIHVADPARLSLQQQGQGDQPRALHPSAVGEMSPAARAGKIPNEQVHPSTLHILTLLFPKRMAWQTFLVGLLGHALVKQYTLWKDLVDATIPPELRCDAAIVTLRRGVTELAEKVHMSHDATHLWFQLFRAIGLIYVYEVGTKRGRQMQIIFPLGAYTIPWDILQRLHTLKKDYSRLRMHELVDQVTERLNTLPAINILGAPCSPSQQVQGHRGHLIELLAQVWQEHEGEKREEILEHLADGVLRFCEAHAASHSASHSAPSPAENLFPQRGEEDSPRGESLDQAVASKRFRAGNLRGRFGQPGRPAHSAAVAHSDDRPVEPIQITEKGLLSTSLQGDSPLRNVTLNDIIALIKNININVTLREHFQRFLASIFEGDSNEWMRYDRLFAECQSSPVEYQGRILVAAIIATVEAGYKGRIRQTPAQFYTWTARRYLRDPDGMVSKYEPLLARYGSLSYVQLAQTLPPSQLTLAKEWVGDSRDDGPEYPGREGPWTVQTCLALWDYYWWGSQQQAPPRWDERSAAALIEGGKETGGVAYTRLAVECTLLALLGEWEAEKERLCLAPRDARGFPGTGEVAQAISGVWPDLSEELLAHCDLVEVDGDLLLYDDYERLLARTQEAQAEESGQTAAYFLEQDRCLSVVQQCPPPAEDVLRAYALGRAPEEVVEDLGVSADTVAGQTERLLSLARAAWSIPASEPLDYRFLHAAFRQFFSDQPGLKGDRSAAVGGKEESTHGDPQMRREAAGEQYYAAASDPEQGVCTEEGEGDSLRGFPDEGEARGYASRLQDALGSEYRVEVELRRYMRNTRYILTMLETPYIVQVRAAPDSYVIVVTKKSDVADTATLDDPQLVALFIAEVRRSRGEEEACESQEASKSA